MTSHLRLVHNSGAGAATGAPDTTASAQDAGLAAAVRACHAVSRALGLADWIGTERALTARGVLKPADAVRACKALDLEVPTRTPRSALDLPDLMYTWRMALRAEVIDLAGRRATAAPGLAIWRSAEPAEVVRRWVRLVLETTGMAETAVPEEEDIEVAGEESLLTMVILHTLYTEGRPVSLHALVTALYELTGLGDADGTDPDWADDQDQDLLEPPPDTYTLLLIEDCVGILADFGAVSVADDDTVGLTTLGTVLARTLLVDNGPPEETDAATVVEKMTEMPAKIATTIVRPWLAARPAAERVHELLTVAEQATGRERFLALSFARSVGVDGSAAWREWSRRPGLGAYARQWLARQGMPVEVRSGDDEWIMTDSIAAALALVPPDLPPAARTALIQQLVGDPADTDLFQRMRASGHVAVPELLHELAAAGVVETTAAHRGSGGSSAGRRRGRAAAKDGRGQRQEKAGATAGTAYRLKITLCGVTEPPVWRRILVRADTPLDELNEVILMAMGWEGYHLHSFSDGTVGYGPPDDDLGFVDEQAVLLSDVLTTPGDRLEHSYDFGDGWEHEILLEESGSADPTMRYPFCITGKGACPPEDCGGVWSYGELKDVLADPSHEEHADKLEWLGLDDPAEFDPKRFSATEVNAMLEPLRRP